MLARSEDDAEEELLSLAVLKRGRKVSRGCLLRFAVCNHKVLPVARVRVREAEMSEHIPGQKTSLHPSFRSQQIDTAGSAQVVAGASDGVLNIFSWGYWNGCSDRLPGSAILRPTASAPLGMLLHLQDGHPCALSACLHHAVPRAALSAVFT